MHNVKKINCTKINLRSTPYFLSRYDGRVNISVLESHLDFHAKKGGDMKKHPLRNNVATRCCNERCGRSVTYSYEVLQLRIPQNIDKKLLESLRERATVCGQIGLFKGSARLDPGRCCFRWNSRTYGFALLNFSAVDAVPDATGDIIRFSRIGVFVICFFYDVWQ